MDQVGECKNIFINEEIFSHILVYMYKVDQLINGQNRAQINGRNQVITYNSRIVIILIDSYEAINIHVLRSLTSLTHSENQYHLGMRARA